MACVLNLQSHIDFSGGMQHCKVKFLKCVSSHALKKRYTFGKWKSKLKKTGFVC